MTKVIFLLFVVLVGVHLAEQTHFLSKEYVNEINNVATTWQAKQNFPPNTNIQRLKGLLGSLNNIPDKKHFVGVHSASFKAYDRSYATIERIPETFDAREQWQNCKTIGLVRNQGMCDNSWAFSISGAFSDRLCIAKQGKFNQLLSVEELTTCCAKCGYGCGYGRFYPLNAWSYFKTRGIVTGGDYNTTDGCQPYTIAPCLIDENGRNTCERTRNSVARYCTKECFGNKTIDYFEDRYRTKNAYYLSSGSIQKDVLTYGPIETTIDVYEDFWNYKSGVYQRTPHSNIMGSHSVKLIGWGEENGVPYWLMVNSWGTQWGENGLFKIRRGKNECRVEQAPTAGVPQ